MRAILAAVMLAGCASAEAEPLAGPEWLSGYWLSCDGTSETAENWIGAGRGVLLGSNISRDRRVTFEFLRIAENASGGLSYFSMPNGRSPPTEFVMVSHDEQRVVFENPAHDFPQRILYARDGDALTARIEGEVEGAAAVEWRFRRTTPDAVCPGR